MNVFQKAWKRLLEAGSFYRYLLVGVGTSLLDFSLFSLLSVGFDLPVIPSNITSTIITVCVLFFCGIDSFYGNGPSIRHHLGDCPRSSRTRFGNFTVLAETCRKNRCYGHRSGM